LIVDAANVGPVLLAAVPALFNVVLLLYVVARGGRRQEMQIFALFLFSLIVWQLSDATSRMAQTPTEYRFWADLLGIGSLLIAPVAVHFALLFTGHESFARSPGFLFLLYGPVLLFESLARAGLLAGPVASNAPWGWAPIGGGPLVLQLVGAWVAAFALGTIAILLVDARRRAPDDPKRAQETVLGLGFAVPVIQGTITQVLFPSLFHLSPAPIASTSMSVFSAAVFWAIRRHRLLDAPSPEERIRDLEATNARQSRMLQEAQRIAQIGSFDYDIRSGQIVWSDQLARINGYEASELGSMPVNRGFGHVHPDDLGPLKQAFEQMKADARAAFQRTGQRDFAGNESEYRIITKQGATRHVRSKTEYLLDESGEPVSCFGVLQDITERRLAEERRAEAESKLRDAERLKAEQEFRVHMLNTISHELRTPITPLRIQAELLASGSLGALTERQSKAAQVFRRNLERLTLLVNEVLDISSLQSGELKLARVRMDLRDACEQALESVADLAQQRGIRLRLLPGPAGVLDADPNRVAQVLLNLIMNAIKFTPGGGSIDVALEEGPSGATVSVRDTGVGIAPADVPRLFQPFGQVGTQGREGTGLGLYISKGIVEAHGGAIGCESPGLGRGTTFWFRLPRAVGVDSAPPARMSRAPAASSVLKSGYAGFPSVAAHPAARRP
jgi:PAS domain S-box-containing protein